MEGIGETALKKASVAVCGIEQLVEKRSQQ